MPKPQFGDYYRVCHECPTPHVENCGTCFGFGVYWWYGKLRFTDGPMTPQLVPLGGVQLDEVRESGEWDRCQECGGTPHGIVWK